MNKIKDAFNGEAPSGYSLTGEFRNPKTGEFFISNTGQSVLKSFGEYFGNRIILKKLAPKKAYRDNQNMSDLIVFPEGEETGTRYSSKYPKGDIFTCNREDTADMHRYMEVDPETPIPVFLPKKAYKVGEDLIVFPEGSETGTRYERINPQGRKYTLGRSFAASSLTEVDPETPIPDFSPKTFKHGQRLFHAAADEEYMVTAIDSYQVLLACVKSPYSSRVGHHWSGQLEVADTHAITEEEMNKLANRQSWESIFTLIEE